LCGGAPLCVEGSAGELIRARLADGGEDVGIGGVDGLLIRREEWPGLQDCDACKLPIAKNAVDGTTAGKPTLTMAEGQVVEPRGKETMAAIVDDVAVVEPGMEARGEIGATGHGESVWRSSSSIGEVACPHIAGVERDSFAAMAGKFNGSAVVVALGKVGDALDDAPVGVGAAALCSSIADGIGLDLVQVDHGFQVLTMAAAVRDAKPDAVAEVLFDSEIPLLDAGIAIVDGESVIEPGCAGEITGGSVEGVGEGQQRRVGSGRVWIVVLVIGAFET
jgi:hypothetical protein